MQVGNSSRNMKKILSALCNVKTVSKIACLADENVVASHQESVRSWETACR